jgi:hypothetical protein
VPAAEQLVTLGSLQIGCAVREFEGAFDRTVLGVLDVSKTSAVNDIAMRPAVIECTEN